MCGIAGIIGRLDGANRAALDRMSGAMVHRGPDGSGSWVSTPNARGWGAMVAHRRLSILDLSPNGAQPMVDEATGHVVVYNGEIYNYQDLRRRLNLQTHALRSSGDTATMLRALGQHGNRAVQRCCLGITGFVLPHMRDEVRHLIARGIPEPANV